MLFDLLIFVVSLVILIYSSESFIENAAKLARSIGVSHFFIGITIFGLGTSLPEITVTGYASYTHDPGIALGNIIGSNITNIALILGFAFFIGRTVNVSDRNLLKDSRLHLILLAFGAYVFLSGNIVSRIEGVILVTVYIVYILYLLRYHTEPGNLNHDDHPTFKTISYTVAGLAGVLVGSKFLVDSAEVLADDLGISSWIIGLIVIALGTSLPELAVTISAAKRGLTMFIMGNIIGSNVTNMMLAMGIASIIRDVPIENTGVIQFYLGFMVLLSVILAAAINRKNISRLWGFLFLVLYVIFIWTGYLLR